MLVLVAGATGNVGQHIIHSLLKRGHSVRILARNPSKLSASSLEKLESVVEVSSYYDVDGLDRATKGVDGIICAYSGLPELSLDGQLLLLRAAERAGVRRFVASSWNYNWEKMALGVHESYDAIIAFQHHVELTSDIRPIYIFCGVLAEVLFAYHGTWSAGNNGVWNPETKSISLWGSGDEIWHWTTEKDAAEFAVEIIQREDAASGGFWNVCSGTTTLKELARTYEIVKGMPVNIDVKGTVSQLRKEALNARKQGTKRGFWNYIGWFYHLHTVDGTWTLGPLDNEKLGFKTTSLEDFLKEYPSI